MKTFRGFAVFFILCVMCATAVFAQSSKKPKWTTYTTDYYGVSFDLPSTWTTDWDKDNKVFTALSPNEELALVFKAFKDETVEAGDLWEDAAKEIAGDDFKLEGDVEEYKNMGGLHAWLGIGHGTVNDVYAVISILAAINPKTDDNLVAYVFADPNVADDSDIETMEKILESFRVAKKK